MLKRICKILNNFILACLIIFSIIMFVPKILGWQNLAVLSGSMEPTIPIGSLVIVKNTDPSELEKGDVITFHMDDSTYVTHRVVDNNKEKKELTTKGDANNTNDGAPVSYSNVIGKLFVSIPYLGYFSISMQSNLGIFILLGVIIILLILNFLPDLVEKLHRSKN